MKHLIAVITRCCTSVWIDLCMLHCYSYSKFFVAKVYPCYLRGRSPRFCVQQKIHPDGRMKSLTTIVNPVGLVCRAYVMQSETLARKGGKMPSRIWLGHDSWTTLTMPAMTSSFGRKAARHLQYALLLSIELQGTADDREILESRRKSSGHRPSTDEPYCWIGLR